METKIPSKRSKRLAIRELLKPHVPSLLLGLLAVAGEGAANIGVMGAGGDEEIGLRNRRG